MGPDWECRACTRPNREAWEHCRNCQCPRREGTSGLSQQSEEERRARIRLAELVNLKHTRGLTAEEEAELARLVRMLRKETDGG